MYVPAEGIIMDEHPRIRYEKHPWMEMFEFDGIRPARPKRTGYGSKDVHGFVKSLNTIYAHAYDDYRLFSRDGEPDSSAYFTHVTEYFIDRYVPQQADDPDNEQDKNSSASGAVPETLLFRKFSGYVENMWREGTPEIYDLAINTILPVIRKNDAAWKIFCASITDEFRDALSTSM